MDEVTGAQLIAESLKTQVKKKKNPLKTHIAKIYKAKKKCVKVQGLRSQV